MDFCFGLGLESGSYFLVLYVFGVSFLFFDGRDVEVRFYRADVLLDSGFFFRGLWSVLVVGLRSLGRFGLIVAVGVRRGFFGFGEYG